MEVLNTKYTGQKQGTTFYHATVKNWHCTRENIKQLLNTIDKWNYGGVVRPMYTDKDGNTVLSVEIWID